MSAHTLPARNKHDWSLQNHPLRKKHYNPPKVFQSSLKNLQGDIASLASLRLINAAGEIRLCRLFRKTRLLFNPSLRTTSAPSGEMKVLRENRGGVRGRNHVPYFTISERALGSNKRIRQKAAAACLGWRERERWRGSAISSSQSLFNSRDAAPGYRFGPTSQRQT